MTTLTLSLDATFPSGAASAARQTTRLETMTMACTVGMAGAGLVILVVMLAQIAGVAIYDASIYGVSIYDVSIYSALMDPAGNHTASNHNASNHTFGMRLAPMLWGLAFLGMHIAHLRRVSDAFWRSAIGITVFTSLAWSISLLFTTLLLTLVGCGVLAIMMAMMMVTGFSITAIGLVIWVVARKLAFKGSLLTGL
mgnify:CR=1 FL=1|tara:strand:- start:2424 stop:3011 length:588 start_codon:yes stop_codon:yes gene_type:complete